MNTFLKTTLIIFLFLPGILNSQEKFPKNIFRAPVDCTMLLSGTFGELRNTHFHSGIDIKTQGVQGKKLYAIADGYVSRIKISPDGYGKAIYIEHPNGYTSVYGHCKSFNGKIDKYIKTEQYKRESYAVDLYLKKDKFTIKKGDIIAYSGNTGRSMGPHLHFEIRKTDGQIPVNPLLFGFPVKDYIRPKILKLKVYPSGNYSLVDGVNFPSEYKIAGWGPKYRLKTGDTINVSGHIYFGIQTHDVLNNSPNHNGVYSISLFIDSVLVYSHKMDEIPFSESRYILSFIDYPHYIKTKKRFQKTRIAPNNRLSVYDSVQNHGIVEFFDDQLHEVFYIIKDANHNESKLTFYVKSSPPDFTEILTNGSIPKNEKLFRYDSENIFENDNVKLVVPEGALYDDLSFEYLLEEKYPETFSAVFHIHNQYTPLQKYCTLNIKPEAVTEDLKDKVLIVRISDENDDFIAMGGNWKGNYLQTEIRDFGRYTVAVDTIPPEIVPVNIYPGKNIKKQYTIKIRIDDELSGIKSYRGTMNGKWILMEYDPKNELLIYHIDNHTGKGKNIFKLVVTDNRSNENIYEAKLIR